MPLSPPIGQAPAINRSAVPRIIPSSGVVTANGALSLTTALPTVYSGGAYLYFPAGAVFTASPAGFYYCVMSTTSVGVIYAERYISGNPTVPATPTPIVSAAIGAYTQALTKIALHTLPIAGGAMGENGVLQTTFKFSNNNNTDNKTVTVELGGTITWSRARTTTISDSSMMQLANRGRLDRQIEVTNLQNGAVWTQSGGSGPSLYSINTASDMDHTVTGQLAVATSYIVLEYFCAEILTRI